MTIRFDIHYPNSNRSFRPQTCTEGFSDALCAFASGISKPGNLQLIGNTVKSGGKLDSDRLWETDRNEERRSRRGGWGRKGGGGYSIIPESDPWDWRWQLLRSQRRTNEVEKHNNKRGNVCSCLPSAGEGLPNTPPWILLSDFGTYAAHKVYWWWWMCVEIRSACLSRRKAARRIWKWGNTGRKKQINRDKLFSIIQTTAQIDS